MEREEWLNSTDPRRGAAAWHAVMTSETLVENDRIAFADWLRKSPAHFEEYMRLSAVRELLRDPQVFDGISLEELRARIGSNVESLGSSEALPTPSGPAAVKPLGTRRTIERRFSIAAAALLACMLGWLVWPDASTSWLTFDNAATSYETEVGEQRSIVLADGSIAELNTRSKLQVHFNAATREVTLNAGEVLFRVAKDAKREFRVHSGSTIVRAIGTEFTVRQDSSQTTVTVLEGRVSVAPSSAAGNQAKYADGNPGTVTHLKPSRVELTAGQRLAVAPGTAVDARAIKRIDPASALAWKSRRLVFDDLRLNAVVAEFNRYNVQQIHVEGAGLDARSITGVFNANDPESFLSFLEGTGGVSVNRSATGNIVIRPQP